MAAGVTGTVVVQARQTVAETEWLLGLAAASVGEDGRRLIRGVVGWAPLADAGFERVLERLCAEPALCGLRHIVQGKAAGFLEGPAFNRGVAALGGTGLVYDVLVYPRQLREAIAFADRHPGQSFAPDHAGKPPIVRARWSPGRLTCGSWAAGRM